MCSLQSPRSPQGRALLCVADEEGVGCALAASVSGFFSSVAMALRPTGQQDVDRGFTAPRGRLHTGKSRLPIEIYSEGTEANKQTVFRQLTLGKGIKP